MNWISAHLRRAIPLHSDPSWESQHRAGVCGDGTNLQAWRGGTKRPRSLFPVCSASYPMKGRKAMRFRSRVCSHRGLSESPHRHREPQQHVVLVGWEPQELRDPRESLRRRIPVQRILLPPERGRERIILCGCIALPLPTLLLHTSEEGL